MGPNLKAYGQMKQRAEQRGVAEHPTVVRCLMALSCGWPVSQTTYLEAKKLLGYDEEDRRAVEDRHQGRTTLRGEGGHRRDAEVLPGEVEGGRLPARPVRQRTGCQHGEAG